MNKKILLPLALLLGTASAAPFGWQNIFNPQNIVVNPARTNLNVRVWLSDNNNQQINNYNAGDRLNVNVVPTRDAYVYLFNVAPDGSVNLLQNRRAGENVRQNFVKANTVKVFSISSRRLNQTPGQNKILALASQTPLDLNQLNQFTSGQVPAQEQVTPINVQGQQQLAQYLLRLINPVPQNAWATATATYTVVAARPRPTAPVPVQVQSGNLQITSNMDGATVYLNDQPIGAANQLYGSIVPGTYTIRVKRAGMQDYTGTVTIRPGTTSTVSVNFASPVSTAPVAVPIPVVATPTNPIYVTPTPVVSQYRLTIRSSLEGARIFIDGQEVGQVRGGALSAALNAGSHQLVMIAPGYSTYTGTINLDRDTNLTISPNK